MGRTKNSGLTVPKYSPQRKELSEKTKKLSENNSMHRMNDEKQNKHIVGTKEYVEGKSVITAPKEYLINYYDNHREEVIKINDYKSSFTFNKIIGYYIDPYTGEMIKTNKVTIHYSKTGYHIVPARPDKTIKGE